MGNLFQPDTKKRHTLDVRTLVGRSRKCDLRLLHPSVTAEHAVLWWDDGWIIRDLGSRNGTWVDGAALSPDHSVRLAAGATLTFGGHPLPWVLESDSGGRVRAVRVSDGLEVEAEGGLLALAAADADGGSAVLYLDPLRGWLLEDDAELRVIKDLDEVAVAGAVWRFHLPSSLASTVDESSARSLSSAALHCRVSADEEHVTLVLRGPGWEVDLDSRSHHYMLLTLARARLRDAALPEPSRGWVYQDELGDMLRLDRSQLNMLVFRARKQLAAAGVEEAGSLIERRMSSQQLRIGVARLEIDVV